MAILEAWWPAIEILIVTGVTKARTEAANTMNREEPRIVDSSVTSAHRSTSRVTSPLTGPDSKR